MLVIENLCQDVMFLQLETMWRLPLKVEGVPGGARELSSPPLPRHSPHPSGGSQGRNGNHDSGDIPASCRSRHLQVCEDRQHF